MAHDILIVDDEADIRELIADILKDEGMQPRMAASSDQVLQALAERVPSAVFLDIWLQGSELDGLGVLEIIKDRYPNVPVIMISGHGTVETAVNAIKIGAYDFIQKPFKEEQLLVVLKRALNHRRMEAELADLRHKQPAAPELVGESPAIQQLRSQVEKLGPTNSRVFITGPAGSGKELLARLIHEHSKRKTAPFVVLNAPNLSPERVERELFGEEDTSSPTGGASHIGMLERAHGGTVFIDEVAEMPMATQTRILRFVQEQVFERVGGRRPVKVDVRLIAATTRNIPHMLAEGNFREDLYYRLNVVPLHMPALSERREDIEVLCEYFLRTASQGLGLPARKIGREAMAMLHTYNWPGNVRQLKNLMERLLILSPGEPETPIRPSMLPTEFFDESPVQATPALSGEVLSLPLKDARELFEKQYLKAQIQRFGNNISRAATFIGMERSALHRKLKALDVNGSENKGETVE